MIFQKFNIFVNFPTMKGQCIRGMKFTTNIIIACIIIHCSIAHNGRNA